MNKLYTRLTFNLFLINIQFLFHLIDEYWAATENSLFLFCVRKLPVDFVTHVDCQLTIEELWV